MPSPEVAEHFHDHESQADAAHLGMWVFLATEVLLFGALFVCYAAYRFDYPAGWVEGRKHMEVSIGTVNTLILIAASIFVVLAISAIRADRQFAAAGLFALGGLAALAFLALKGVEYSHHAQEGALPGMWYAVKSAPVPGASMFMTLYWLMTGLHGVHVAIGAVVLFTLAGQTAAGKYDATSHTALEVGGMYWHLVDVIWLFLYPLFYLV